MQSDTRDSKCSAHFSRGENMSDELKFQKYIWLLLFCEKTAIRERLKGFFCWLWQPYPFLMWLMVICYSWSWSKQPARLIQSSTCYQNPFSFRLRRGKWAQRCQFIFCWMQKCTEISPGCHFLKFFWNLFGFGNSPTLANLFKLLWTDMKSIVRLEKNQSDFTMIKFERCSYLGYFFLASAISKMFHNQ